MAGEAWGLVGTRPLLLEARQGTAAMEGFQPELVEQASYQAAGLTAVHVGLPWLASPWGSMGTRRLLPADRQDDAAMQGSPSAGGQQASFRSHVL